MNKELKAPEMACNESKSSFVVRQFNEVFVEVDESDVERVIGRNLLVTVLRELRRELLAHGNDLMMSSSINQLAVTVVSAVF